MLQPTAFMNYMAHKLEHNCPEEYSESGYRIAILHGDPSNAQDLVKACKTQTRLKLDYITTDLKTEVFVLGGDKEQLRAYNWFYDNLTTCVQVDYCFECSLLIQELMQNDSTYLWTQNEDGRINTAWFSGTGFVPHSYWERLSKLFVELEALQLINFKLSKSYCPFENLILTSLFNPLNK
jgi:hypothetical protein